MLFLFQILIAISLNLDGLKSGAVVWIVLDVERRFQNLYQKVTSLVSVNFITESQDLNLLHFVPKYQT